MIRSVDGSNKSKDSKMARARKTARAVKVWNGNDTFGARWEVAQSETGEFYARYWRYNGHGLAPCKWFAYTPSFSDTGCMELGFQRMYACTAESAVGVRLPKQAHKLEQGQGVAK